MSYMMDYRLRDVRAAAVLFAALLLTGVTLNADNSDQAAQDPKPPLATFMTVEGQVDDVQFGRIQNAALELQNQSRQAGRRAFLVLEVRPGSSPFHQVEGLARFLTSSEMNDVTTVAWIPKTVTGHNVVVALACNEIIMHPDAELGDVGRGKALERDLQASVLRLVEKRYNRMLSPALVQGMMDPQQEVLKMTVHSGEAGNETTESLVVTPEEYTRKRDEITERITSEKIKRAGFTGTFSGTQARSLGILVVRTAESRGDIAEHYNLPLESLREDPTTGEAPDVRLIKIDDMIEPVLEAFVKRQIERAVGSGANLLIFEIHSPGGFLLSSKNLADAIADLQERKIRTVAYIPEEALSGAAIIALGCDEIYLHPHAKIGDAGPIEVSEGQQFERAPEKVLSVLREMLRELAERKNRPPALAMAMADKDLRVYQVTHRENGRVWYMTENDILDSNGEWIKGRIVPESEKDLLLTLNGRRAHELLLARSPVKDREQLKQRLGIPADVRLKAVGRTWVDTLVFVLNNQVVVGLLFFLGVFCLFLEMQFVSGFFGLMAALCFSVMFWSQFMGGTAGWLEVTLFVLGLVSIGIEIFVIPGFGVFGIFGGLMVFGAMVMAAQTFGNLEPHADFQNTLTTMGTLSLSVVSVVIAAMVMSRYLPHVPVLNKLILAPPGQSAADDSDEPRLRPDLAGENGAPATVGQEGQALSVLRPAGKASIGDRIVDVVSDGPYINQGSTVKVVQVSGNRVVVREVV